MQENDPWYIWFYGFRPHTLLIMYSAIAVLGILGVVGNVVSMVIWTRPQLKSSTSVLLTALAACDLLILISANSPDFLYYLWLAYRGSPTVDYINKFINPFVFVWCQPMYFTAQTASIYLTLAVTLERYIAVCRLFLARVVCTYSRACKTAATIITLSILYNLIRFFDVKVVTRVDDNGDVTSYETGKTELSGSPLYKTIFEIQSTWLRLILIYLLPLICIAVLNTLIYLELRKMKKRREAMTNSQSKEKRLAMMLVYVVTEFLFCSSVTISHTITMQILKLSFKQLGYNPFRFTPLSRFFNTFNSSSNIFTYIVFGRAFREALLSTFSCCRLKFPNRTDDLELDVRPPEFPV